MKDAFKPGLLRSAYDDLLNRTLAKIPSEFGRLIYLASTRDYNSGSYHHEGLSTRFTSEDASAALWAAHREIFWRLASLSLEEVVRELDAYIQSSHEQCDEILHAWLELEPYRVAIPMDVDPIMAQLLLSNIKIGLEVLRIRQKKNSASPSGAWPLPSPAR
ncbi:MAG TPA: hypothetical protein VLX32_10385 [Candidatus Acidoferrum sp.]|nr:hypothetical protein [Candidatus Acidoferrum sp.]